VGLGRHPHIVHAQWVQAFEGKPFIFQEYLSGGTLVQMFKREGILAIGRALELALRLCDAMAYAQEQLDLVHRDLKPSNLMLAKDGSLKATDFGLAKVVEAVSQPQQTVGPAAGPVSALRAIGLAGLGGRNRGVRGVFGGLGEAVYPILKRRKAGLEIQDNLNEFCFGELLQLLSCHGGDPCCDGECDRAAYNMDVVSSERVPA